MRAETHWCSKLADELAWLCLQGAGVICCFSLKNPSHPEYSFTTGQCLARSRSLARSLASSRRMVW